MHIGQTLLMNDFFFVHYYIFGWYEWYIQICNKYSTLFHFL